MGGHLVSYFVLLVPAEEDFFFLLEPEENMWANTSFYLFSF